MDSKKIRALLEIHKCRSITAAAEKLGYTQPGLTNMMNALEAELGLELLIRSRSGARLSPAGEDLLPAMESFLSADAALLEQSEKLCEHAGTSLQIGAYASVSKAWLPVIIARFRDETGRTNTDITMDDIKNLYAAVRDERLDCAIVSLQQDLMKDLEWVPLYSDELLAILPEDYDTENSCFPVEDFDGKEFLMPSLGFDRDILPALNTDGRMSKAVFHYTNLDDSAIVSMVAHKLGCSILSELVMQGISDHVRSMKLFPAAFRKLGIICRADRHGDKGLRAFISIAEDTVADIYSSREVQNKS